MARRGNTMHWGFLVGFIVLALLGAILGFMTYEKSGQIEKLANDLKTAKENAVKADAERLQEKQLRIDEGRFLYGWNEEGEKAKSTVPSH